LANIPSTAVVRPLNASVSASIAAASAADGEALEDALGNLVFAMLVKGKKEAGRKSSKRCAFIAVQDVFAAPSRLLEDPEKTHDVMQKD
jgi:hypothetical protein